MDDDLERTRQLFEDARAGRREAYEELFRTCRPELLRLVRFRLEGQRLALDASDVAQDALVDALQNFERWESRGPGSFRRWLAAIVENRIRQNLRSTLAARRDAGRVAPLVEASRSDLGPPAPVPPVEQTSPSGAAAREEERARIERALEELAPDQRDVLRLVKLRELPIAEVARTMQRSENAVKKLLARALGELRARLEHEQAREVDDDRGA